MTIHTLSMCIGWCVKQSSIDVREASILDLHLWDIAMISAGESVSRLRTPSIVRVNTFCVFLETLRI